MQVIRIGIDVATQVFQGHGVDRHGQVVRRKPLPRGKMRGFFAQLPPCLIGIEACASAHDWARAWSPFGHTVRRIAPQLVRPYRKHPKHDGKDAEAICEALPRPNMRVVPAKSIAQQAVLTVHRARELLVRDRPALVNQGRGVLAEYGLVVPPGIARRRRVVPSVLADAGNELPVLVREVIAE